MKNPLFPLQITVENVQRARDVSIQNSSTKCSVKVQPPCLPSSLSLRRSSIASATFPKCRRPTGDPRIWNAIVRGVMKLFDAQLTAQGVKARLELVDERLAAIRKPTLPNCSARCKTWPLNALDAMPSGGVLTVRTAHSGEFGASGGFGLGLRPHQGGVASACSTPYYTTKQHGTGLGLAIVQSVVSDHGGRISVDSEPGRGSTFRIELENGKSPHRERRPKTRWPLWRAPSAWPGTKRPFATTRLARSNS